MTRTHHPTVTHLAKVIPKKLWIVEVVHALTVTPNRVVHALTVTGSRINCDDPI